MWLTLTLTLTVLLAVGLVWHHLWWRRRYADVCGRLQEREQSHHELEHHQQQIFQHQRAEQDAMFNSMSEGVLVLDGNGRIQWLNQSLEEMFNLKTDVRQKGILDAFQLNELADVVTRVLKDKTVQDYQLELLGPRKRVVQINAATVRDRNLARDGAILVFHDLTRIKELENTRQEFVANVSHELRTPLALIKGYVETLLDGAKNNAEQTDKFLRIIDKHTDRLTFLIDDLLTISRLESGQAVMNFQHVVLHEAVEVVLEELQSRAMEKETEVENVVPVDLVSLADADRLHQVFFNLVENAIKYGRPKGRVSVGGQSVADNKIELWVRDNGPGIQPEFRERVFERFYRIDKARSRETGGTGLGLSIVKHIVHAHGGDLWVRSEVGKGTTFCFTLPEDRERKQKP